MSSDINRKLELAASTLKGVGAGLQTVFISAILLGLTQSYTYVGLAEGVPSALALLVALPAGIYTDLWPERELFPKNVGLLLQLLGYGVMGVAFASIDYVDPFHVYWIIFGSLLFIAAGFGLAAGQMESIWNSSVETGQRTKWSNLRRNLGSLGSAAGPFMGVFLILALKTDSWSLGNIVAPFSMGMCCYVVAFGLRLQVSVGRTMGEDKCGDVMQKTADNDAKLGKVRKCCCFGASSIPILKLTMDMWYAVASGLTIKYFPLWLLDLGLTPLELNIAVGCQYLGIAIFGALAKPIADRIGRMQIALWSKCLGLACFLIIIVGEPTGLWNIPALMATMQVLRTGLMNSCSGITGAVLNDYVPQKSRAKWNSLDAVTRLGWSASALIGGLILDKIDVGTPLLAYRDLFIITFTMQSLGLIIIFILTILVPKEELSLKKDPEDSSKDVIDSEALSLLEFPVRGDNETDCYDDEPECD